MKKHIRMISVLTVLMFTFGMMLSGCQSTSKEKENTPEPETTEEITPLSAIEKQLGNGFSYTISYQFSQFPFYGFSQAIVQNSAKDGSYSFTCETIQWNTNTDFKETDFAEYYYRYEDDVFVCYVRNNGGEVSRIELSDKQLKEMERDREIVVGYASLFPSYLADFTEEVAGEKYTFRLPLEKVMDNDSYLAVFLNNVFKTGDFEGAEGLDSVEIPVTCTVEKDSYRPVEIKYDFSELKPYVLSNGAMSAEFALDTDLMYLVYTFDFDLPETAQPTDGLSDAIQQ